MATRAGSPAVMGVVFGLVLPLISILLWPYQSGDDVRVVTVYTAHNQEIIDTLLPDFEASTGIRVNVVKIGGSGDVIRRVRAESADPKCDVIWSISADQLHAHPEVLRAPPPEFWEQVAPEFRIGNGWVPYTGIVMCFVVNTDLLQGDAIPRRWTDLTRPDLQGLISSSRANKSGTAFTQLITVLTAHPDDGWEIYRGILKNAILSPSSSAVSRLVNDGERAVGITIEDNAFRYVQGGGPVTIVYPEDGTVAVPDGCSLVKGSPHPDEGYRFLQWALSKTTQDALVEHMGRRPAGIDAVSPPVLPRLSELKVMPYDFDAAAEQKDAIMQRWHELVTELGR